MKKVEYKTSNTNMHHSNRNRSSGAPIRTICLIVLFLVMVAGTICGISFFASQKFVIIPGEISFDESVSELEKTFINDSLQDIKLGSNVTFYASTESTKLSAENTVIYDVYVPVTGLYNPKSNLTEAEFLELEYSTEPTLPYDSTEIKLISANDLTSSVKLLSVNNNYYLDDYTSSAKYRIIRFETNDINEILQANDGAISKREFLNSEKVLSINQTGVTALARAMQTKLKQVNDGAYFAAKIKDYLAKTDLTHISNEVSFADNCEVDSGSVVLCSPNAMMDSIKAIGTDIIELTGNHNNDWSVAANRNTIQKYEEEGYKTFGGGKDEATAAIPLTINQKGTNITWIGFNLSTSTKANGQAASGENPGANAYDETMVREQISKAKENGDFVIVDIQYFECYCYPDGYVEMPACDTPDWGYDQRGFFKSIADMGADLIVGTQAHQPQTFETYNNTPIYYGLGNLFFDQTYWPGTERGIILTHYFNQGKLIQTRVMPTVYHSDLQVNVMSAEEAETFLRRLGEAR